MVQPARLSSRSDFGKPGDALGIEPGGGLIEQQHGGAMNQRAGDGDALAHAARKCADLGGAAIIEANFTEKSFGADSGGFDILESGEKQEIFLGGEFVVDHRGVGDVAGAGIAGGLLSAAGKREFAVRGANNLSGDAEKGGLAGAVATGKDGAFAGRNFKSDAAERE